MSSTGRGGVRHPDDLYESPAWCVDALLRRVGPLDGMRILEPSAGSGAIVRRLLAAGARPDNITAIEPDEKRAAEVNAIGVDCYPCTFEDWAGGRTEWGFPHIERGWQVIVMNPPFFAAQAHIELSLSLLAPGGLCCALERLAFGASRKRADFRARHPYDKIELASRPSFTAESLAKMTEADLLAARIGEETIDDVRKRLRGTDSADYAWFCFGAWPSTHRTGWDRLRCGGRFTVAEDAPRASNWRSNDDCAIIDWWALPPMARA